VWMAAIEERCTPSATSIAIWQLRSATLESTNGGNVLADSIGGCNTLETA
jgi:hypothetical protein